MEETTYSETIKCPNCGCVNYAEIPTGTTINEYKEETKCRRCRCNLRDKDFKKSIQRSTF